MPGFLRQFLPAEIMDDDGLAGYWQKYQWIWRTLLLRFGQLLVCRITGQIRFARPDIPSDRWLGFFPVGEDSYDSSPSSPGSRAQVCQVSSSAWAAQNQRPQIPQWKVAAESQGSSRGETA